MKTLLQNYRALTESQETLLQSNLVLASKVPPPEEIVTPASRFRVITDKEINQMRERLAQSKVALDKDQIELQSRKQYVADMAKKLDEDKIRIAAQRQEFEERRKRLEVDSKIQILREVDQEVENRPPAADAKS